MDAFMRFVIFFAIAVGLAALMTFPVMWVINGVFAPEFLVFVFGVSQMTFTKTFLLSIFISMLKPSPGKKD
jgi:hypothetical protein